jgi:hypothetical protein
MPRAKAQYSGQDEREWGEVRHLHTDEARLTEWLIERLQRDGHTDSADWVGYLVGEARTLNDWLIEREEHTTREELKLEQSDIVTAVASLSDKLRHLSPDFNRLLAVDAQPLFIADELDRLHQQLQDIDTTIQGRKPKKSFYLIEFTVRVVQLLDGFNIPVTSTLKGDISDSLAIDLLGALGRAAGADIEDATWRDYLTQANES